MVIPHRFYIVLLYAICIVFTKNTLIAQDKPEWTIKLPNPTNNTYIYVHEQATADFKQEAFNRAIAQVFAVTSMRMGLPFDSRDAFDAMQQGTPMAVISLQYNIPIYKVCEYTEKVGFRYTVHVLCQVAFSGNVTPMFDYSFRDCVGNVQGYNNGVSLLKSAFVPGLGQMGKRHYCEGLLTLFGEAALIGGATTTYYIGREGLSQLKSGTLSYDDYAAYQKHYNHLRTANTILWSAAAVLYVFNLYRAYAAYPRIKQTMTLNSSLIQSTDEIIPSLGITLNF